MPTAPTQHSLARRLFKWALARFDATADSPPTALDGVDCDEAFRTLPWRVKAQGFWWFARVTFAALVVYVCCVPCWVMREDFA